MSPVPAAARSVLLLGLAFLATGALLPANLAVALPPAQWWSVLAHPQANDIRELVLRDSLLPRLAVSLLCGAGLGLAGTLFQQVLGNPLAEPGTLGVFAGAKLALAGATLWAPTLLIGGYEPVALAGACLCTGLVFALSSRRRFAPLAIILAGLVVGLSVDAVNRMLVLAHFDALGDLFAWQAGALDQNNWSVAVGLVPRLAIAGAAAALLRRPLALLEIGEAGARSTGSSVAGVRLAALAVGVLVSASVVGAVGVIGFIGLAGPAVARLAGARRLRDRLVFGPISGAFLLTLTDQLVQRLGGLGGVPTGTMTALLGAPVLIVLIVRLRAPSPPGRIGEPIAARLLRPWRFIGVLALLLAIGASLALILGRVPGGWSVDDPGVLLPWRAPRVFAALGAGAMLAGAGTLLQRLTGNPLASPELLGISAGAALALVVGLLFAPTLGRPGLVALAGGGALFCLLAVLSLGRRSGYAPGQMLLVGVALTSLLGSIVALLLAAADPRTAVLLTWLAGSTYNATPGDAAFACTGAVALLAVAPFLARWLAILPLGAGTGRAVGLHVARARLTVLAVAAALTGAATLLVGPLSFVGLIAPHLAREIGVHRPTAQLFAAGLIGALVMVLADWIGRMIAFPWQLPAGLVATSLGGLYFAWLMLRR